MIVTPYLAQTTTTPKPADPQGPRLPAQPLPSEVLAPATELLGWGVYVANAVFVLAIIVGAGLLWWVYLQGNPATGPVRKIAWAIGCAIAVSSAASIAGFILN